MNTLTTYVALLRGINVGGNNIISMADLKACVERLGHKRVRTYINSGNVIFQSASADARQIERALEEALAPRFKAPIAVVARTLAEMRATLASVPPGWLTAADLRCYVIFLRHTIDRPELLERFTLKPAIEDLRYAPGTLFWSTRLDSLTKSSLSKQLNGRAVFQEMTVRNLNTLQKLCALMGEVDGSA
ncbi:MAG TPA: DUF1697 domain-containing protein [Ktedonobacterales bacterium]|nr:DUF1697 domain-containing protein [Ktedonobacterales bacterium]